MTTTDTPANQCPIEAQTMLGKQQCKRESGHPGAHSYLLGVDYPDSPPSPRLPDHENATSYAYPCTWNGPAIKQSVTLRLHHVPQRHWWVEIERERWRSIYLTDDGWMFSGVAAIPVARFASALDAYTAALATPELTLTTEEA